MTKRTDINIEFKIIEEYKKGKSTRYLANKYNLGSKTTVSRIIKRYKVELTDEMEISKRRKYTLNEDYFETIDSDDKAYWLGFICADGHVADYGIIIGLSNVDRGHLIKFLNCIGSNSNIYDNKKKNTSYISLYSYKIVSSLRKLGLYRDKTYSLEMPNIDKIYYRSFLRGLFDGDGCLHFSKYKHKYYNCYNYTQSFALVGNFDMMKEISNYISKELGVSFKNPYYVRRTKQLYQIKWAGKKDVCILLKYLYKEDGIKLDRKYEKKLEFDIWLEGRNNGII